MRTGRLHILPRPTGTSRGILSAHQATRTQIFNHWYANEASLPVMKLGILRVRSCVRCVCFSVHRCLQTRTLSMYLS